MSGEYYNNRYTPSSSDAAPYDNDSNYHPPKGYTYQAPNQPYYYTKTPIILPNQAPLYVYVPTPQPTQQNRYQQNTTQPNSHPLDNDSFYQPPRHNQQPHQQPARENLYNDQNDWYNPDYTPPQDNDSNYTASPDHHTHGAYDYPFYFDE